MKKMKNERKKKRGWLVGEIGGRDTVGGEMEKREGVKEGTAARRNTFVPAACIPCSRTCS